MARRWRQAALSLACITTAATGKAEPVEARAVSFQDAVGRALARNPTLETAQAEVRRSEALIEQARSGWYPSLTANAQFTRFDDDRVFNNQVIQGANLLTANVQLVVPLVAPQAWFATARARDNADVARASSIDARRAVALATGRAYLTIVAQRRLVETAKRARDTAKAHEDDAQTRLRSGLGTRLDLVRASQQRAAADQDVVTQSNGLVRAREALGLLVGEAGPMDVTGDASLETPASLPAAMRQAESHRSDLAVQRERHDAAQRAVGSSYTAYLPSLTFVGEPFYSDPRTLLVPNFGYRVYLALSMPIYDGGRRYGQVHELQALRDQAGTAFDRTAREVRSDVRTAHDSMLAADEALARAREGAAFAGEALQLAQRAYQAGTTSNLELVDAERRARDAEAGVAVAENAASVARLELLAAMGRFPP